MTNVALVTDGAHHDHSALKFEIKVKYFLIIEDLFGKFFLFKTLTVLVF